ncbi:MAG: outer membrane beta-barrel protein [Bdellovibrionota bacterium]
MQRFLGLFLFSIMFISFNAKADLLLEPVIGYSMGLKGSVKEGTISGTGLKTTEDKFSGGSGPSFGGRVGYQKLGLQVGLDYLHSSVNPSDKEFKSNLDINEWAAFVGFEFPILFRVYGAYIFSADGQGKYDTGTSFEKLTLKDGSGLKAGLGFTLLPFLDINLEYRRGTFGEWKAGSIKVDGDVDYSIYMIGLSLPFTI